MPAKKTSTKQPKTSAKKATKKVQESPPPTPVEPEPVETPVESVEQKESSIMNYRRGVFSANISFIVRNIQGPSIRSEDSRARDRNKRMACLSWL